MEKSSASSPKGASRAPVFYCRLRAGFEQIVKKGSAPIVPICLDHVWGSIFSYQEKRFFWKMPERIPRHVHVNFGPPMPSHASAFQVRQVIQKLSADSAIRRNRERSLVHRRFVRMACRHPFRVCLIDQIATKPIMKYGEVLTGVKILNRRLKPLLADQDMVGVWLPSSTGGDRQHLPGSARQDICQP